MWVTWLCLNSEPSWNILESGTQSSALGRCYKSPRHASGLDQPAPSWRAPGQVWESLQPPCWAPHCSCPPTPEPAQRVRPGLCIAVPHLFPPRLQRVSRLTWSFSTSQANLPPWADHGRRAQVGWSTEIQTNEEGEALNSDSFHNTASDE